MIGALTCLFGPTFLVLHGGMADILKRGMADILMGGMDDILKIGIYAWRYYKHLLLENPTLNFTLSLVSVLYLPMCPFCCTQL